MKKLENSQQHKVKIILLVAYQLDYDYIKNHYGVIAVDLSKQI